MSHFPRSISLPFKRIALLLLLAGSINLIQAEEGNAPVFAPSSASSDASTTGSTTILTNFKGVNEFLEDHASQIQWVMDNPIPVTAAALVFAILCRMVSGERTPVVPIPRPVAVAAVPQKKPKQEPKKAKAPKAEPKPVVAVASEEPKPKVSPFQDILAQALQSPASIQRDGVIAQTFERWAASEPKTALDWALNLTDREWSDRLITTELMAKAEKDPSAAIDLALSLPASALQEKAVNEITRQWTRQQPESAAAKIIALPETQALQTAITALVETWAGMDLESTHHWLVALPINLQRDLAFHVFIRRLTVDSPETAAAWVDSIANTEIRRQTAGFVAEKWQTVDAEAASAWREKALV